MQKIAILIFTEIIISLPEFLDDCAIDAFNKFSDNNMHVAQSLFLEFHGPETGLEDQFDTVRE